MSYEKYRDLDETVSDQPSANHFNQPNSSIMNLKQVIASIIAFSVIFPHLMFAQNESKKLTSREQDFLVHTALGMLMYKAVLTHCSSNVMVGNKKMRNIELKWIQKYWPTTLELRHYMAKNMIERQDATDDKYDIDIIKSELFNLSKDELAKAFDGRSERKQKKICKDAQRNSMKDGRQAYLIYTAIEQKTLVQAYGRFDGQTEKNNGVRLNLP